MAVRDFDIGRGGLRRNLTDQVSRLLIAGARRSPVEPRKLYLPSLSQSVDLPGRLSSTFGEIFIAHAYSPLRPLPAHPTIVDLGASFGLFTIFMNQHVCGGEIWTFEASPATYRHLSANIARMRRRGGNEIRLHNVAVSNHAGEIDFFIDTTNSTNVAATAYREVSSYPDARHFVPIKVACDRLDSFFEGKIDFLKCDIEGAEYHVLGGELLKPSRLGEAVVEFHDVERNRARFVEIVTTLLDRGYRIFDHAKQPLTEMRDSGAFERFQGSVLLRFFHESLDAGNDRN